MDLIIICTDSAVVWEVEPKKVCVCGKYGQNFSLGWFALMWFAASFSISNQSNNIKLTGGNFDLKLKTNVWIPGVHSIMGRKGMCPKSGYLFNEKFSQ